MVNFAQVSVKISAEKKLPDAIKLKPKTFIIPLEFSWKLFIRTKMSSLWLLYL